MEIELDLRGESAYLVYGLTALIVIVILLGLAAVGRQVTPLTESGAPRLLSWSDWRLVQEERAYQEQLVVLRSDATQLTEMLRSRPDPVAAQVLLERISRDTQAGDPALTAARGSLISSAQDVRDWAAGVLDQDSAISSLQKSLALLQQ